MGNKNSTIDHEEIINQININTNFNEDNHINVSSNIPIRLKNYPEKYLPHPSTRTMQIFKYDVKKYPFREIMIEIFKEANLEEKFLLNYNNIDGNQNNNFDNMQIIEQAFNTIHLLKGNNVKETRTNNSPFHKIYMQITRKHGSKTKREMEIFEKYNALLNRFCKDIVSLKLASNKIIYQRRPTLRVNPPSEKAMGHPHIDYEYHHQPSEINFWIPINNICKSMSLYVETIPDKKDFKPMEMEYGECLMFWGNQCKHYTIANDTTNTRVSIDFRCMDEQRYNPNYVNLKGRPTQFRIGEYFTMGEEEEEEEEGDGETGEREL